MAKTSTYRVKHSLSPKPGYVVIEIPYFDKVALAAAWGLMASVKFGETYRVMISQVAFRLTRRRYNEWKDIVKSCNSDYEESES